MKHVVEKLSPAGWVEYRSYSLEVVADTAAIFFNENRGKTLGYRFEVHPEAITGSLDFKMSGDCEETIPDTEFRFTGKSHE